jgi:O-acetylserine/cysteine efflux transporter
LFKPQQLDHNETVDPGFFMALRDILLALLLVTMWGSTFTAMKVGVVDMPPLVMNTLRFGLSAFPAILLLKRPAVPLWTIFAFGILLGVLKFTMLFTSLKLGMPAGLASIILQMQVFFTIGFAFIAFRERPNPMQKIGASIAFVGMVLFAIDKSEGATLGPFLLCLLAASMWGVANIIVKIARTQDILAFVVWSSAVAAPILFGLAWMIEGGDILVNTLINPSWTTVLLTLYLSFGATLLGFFIWNGLLTRYPVARVGPFALLIPVSGMGCGILFLGERFSLLAILASLVVFLGLFVNVFGDRLIQKGKKAP